MDVPGPSDGIAHPARVTDLDQLLKRARLLAFAGALPNFFAIKFLEVALDLPELVRVLRHALGTATRAQWRRLERSKAHFARAH